MFFVINCFLDIFIDTTGYSFTLPLFKYIAGCKTGCYVHYPTITTEMLKRVSNRTTMYNNRSFIARSPFFTTGKLMYYRLFAWVCITKNKSNPTIFTFLYFLVILFNWPSIRYKSCKLNVHP